MSAAVPRLRWGQWCGQMQALRMKSQFERMVHVARDLCGEAQGLSEMIAAVSVRQECERWLSMTVEHLAALKRRRGWSVPALRDEARASGVHVGEADSTARAPQFPAGAGRSPADMRVGR